MKTHRPVNILIDDVKSPLSDVFVDKAVTLKWYFKGGVSSRCYFQCNVNWVSEYAGFIWDPACASHWLLYYGVDVWCLFAETVLTGDCHRINASCRKIALDSECHLRWVVRNIVLSAHWIPEGFSTKVIYLAIVRNVAEWSIANNIGSPFYVGSYYRGLQEYCRFCGQGEIFY